MLCGSRLILGKCINCKLNNNESSVEKNNYVFRFKFGEIKIPIKNKKISIEEFCEKNDDFILEKLDELKEDKENEKRGYFKGKMCPFTQVKIGGTRPATLAFTGASVNEYHWTHTACIERYCAIWDEKNKRCSILTIANKLSKS